MPLPDVKWFKDGRSVPSTAIRNGTDLIKSEIVINRFRPSDAGIYKCRFYNDENGTAEANTTISIALFCVMIEMIIVISLATLQVTKLL